MPSLLTATVNVPTATATTKYVLTIDPVFIDAQADTHIYYDSQSPCLGNTGSGPCDSQVTMPVFTGSAPPQATPTPTPGATPAATPPPASAGNPRYHTYLSPPGVADDWGEPSIGVNWLTEKLSATAGEPSRTAEPACPTAASEPTRCV